MGYRRQQLSVLDLILGLLALVSAGVVAIVAVVFGVAVVIGGVVNVVVNDVVKGRFFATRRSIGRQELTF